MTSAPSGKLDTVFSTFDLCNPCQLTKQQPASVLVLLLFAVTLLSLLSNLGGASLAGHSLFQGNTCSSIQQWEVAFGHGVVLKSIPEFNLHSQVTSKLAGGPYRVVAEKRKESALQ